MSTTYTADTSPTVSSPHDRLYADVCLWDNNPNSPNYRNCLGDGKAGGTIATTYTVRIITGGGTSQSLNSLIHDFSGASYHYNSDYSASARIANIIDPTGSNFQKRFAPASIAPDGISTLIFTISNTTPTTVTGYNFTDMLPSDVTVAAMPNATTSGCGTPIFAPIAGANSLTFSNGTVAGSSSCTISVNVTASSTGTYNNTSGNLFIGTSDTDKMASATLSVQPVVVSCVPGLTLATWTFPVGSSTTAPAPSSSSIPASASAGTGFVNNPSNGALPVS